MIDDTGYDAELLDAEIIVDRTTDHATFTKDQLAAYLGFDERWLRRQVSRGKLPGPMVQGDSTRPSLWTRRQVIGIIAKRLEAGERVPA